MMAAKLETSNLTFFAAITGGQQGIDSHCLLDSQSGGCYRSQVGKRFLITYLRK